MIINYTGANTNNFDIGGEKFYSYIQFGNLSARKIKSIETIYASHLISIQHDGHLMSL